MRQVRLASSLVFLTVLAASPAVAAPLRVGFTATVTSVEGTPPVAVPATITGSFPFLPGAFDLLGSNPAIGLYAPNFFLPEGTIRIDLGGTPLGFGVVPAFTVFDGAYDDADAGLAGADAFRAGATLLEDGPGGAFAETIEILLVDPDATALAGDAFPAMPPDLADWVFRTIEIRLERCTDPFGPCDTRETEFAILGTIDAVSLVPEPSVPLLALAASFAFRRRRRSCARGLGMADSG